MLRSKCLLILMRGFMDVKPISYIINRKIYCTICLGLIFTTIVLGESQIEMVMMELLVNPEQILWENFNI